MADIDLEAEQVVGEEQEQPPKKSRSKPRMGLMIFGAVVIVEAVVLFFVFDAVSSPKAEAESGEEVSQLPDEFYKSFGRIEVAGVSVFDESDPRHGADRRFTMDVTVWIERETYEKIQAVADGENDQIFDVIADRLRTEIRDFLAQQGGASLKSRVNEKEFREDLRDHLVLNLQHLKVKDVYISNFRPQRY